MNLSTPLTNATTGAVTGSSPGHMPASLLESQLVRSRWVGTEQVGLRSRGLSLPPNCLETLSVSVARLVAIRSDAVWFTPMGAVREDLAQGLLRRLPLATGGTEEPVGLLRRSEAQSDPCAALFMTILREAAELRRVAGGDWTLV